MSCLFIPDDGYTLPFTVKARQGVHPALVGTYRPALPEAVQRYLDVLARPGADVLKAKVELLSKHVISWEATWPDGSAVPVSAETIRKLRFQALCDLVDIVTGYALAAPGQDSQSETDAKNS